MAACTECNLCDHPGTLATARDVAQIPCNVRCFQDHVFTVWRCTGCGSLHCKEDADLAAYYADYPIKLQKLSFHDRVGYRNRLRMLRAHGVGPAARVLDYGCGPGLYVDYLREHGFKNAAGYDPYEARFSDAQLLDGTYDAVVSYDVIEHDEDPLRFLRSLTRLVKPGGVLLIGTPNADRISLARTRNPALHMPYHRHILSEKVMQALGQECGLETLESNLRSYFDSVIPSVNSRFMWRYVEKQGFLDAAFEPPNLALVLRSPDLLFLAFFGYLMPVGDNMTVAFKRHCATESQRTQKLLVERSTEIAAVVKI
jgi:SAM-dependent methyltransferase